jgi:L-lactate utilization protein LutB
MPYLVNILFLFYPHARLSREKSTKNIACGHNFFGKINLSFEKTIEGEKGNLHSQRDYHLIIIDNDRAEVLN